MKLSSPRQPEEFKEAVRALWRDGRSSGEIADAKGVTRNTVIGILQRLGEDRRTQGRGASAKALPKPKLASVPLASPTVAAEPRPISLAVVKAAATIQISDGGAGVPAGSAAYVGPCGVGTRLAASTGTVPELEAERAAIADKADPPPHPNRPVSEKAQALRVEDSHNAGMTPRPPAGMLAGSNPGPSETKPSRYAWAPERNETLRRLVADGVPIRRIAFEMQTTRVTVRTKMKLLGIVRERPPTPTLDQRMEAPAPLLNKPATAAPARPLMRTPEISQPISDSAPVTFFDLEKCMCRWPLPHAADDEALYCGARCEFHASYCDFHCDASTNPKYRRPRGASGERLPIGRSVTASVSRSV